MTAAAIVADGLVKRFGELEALKGVSFEVPEGKVLGLLGPNGAGKTTAVRMLTTLLKPDDGTGDVFFHITALREGADVAVGVGIAVSFEMGTDKRTGKTKAVSVDLV